MARGEMVRYMAENNIENPMDIKKFNRLGYSFRSDLSSDSKYVFERNIAGEPTLNAGSDIRRSDKVNYPTED